MLFANVLHVSADECLNFARNGLVTYSPDRTAFSIGYGDRSAATYSYGQVGYRVQIHGITGPQQLMAGQHYYDGLVKGEVKVGYWRLSNPFGMCIHSGASNCSVSSLDRMGANRSNCGRVYNAGWIGYCAVCDEPIAYVFFYMTEQMAMRTAYLPSGKSYSYYFYLCPYDNSLENYCPINHVCTQVSANKYKIIYNAGNSSARGRMSSGWFIYGDDNTYEGNENAGGTRLSKCAFTVTGKTFLGWSDKPNGEVLFADEESWTNVMNKMDIGNLQDCSSVVLYAVWGSEDESGESMSYDPYNNSYGEISSEVVGDLAQNGYSGEYACTDDDISLRAEIVRCLCEDDGRSEFIRGEQGILNIELDGSAEYVVVEFPRGMEAYNYTFDYTQRGAEAKSEAIDFFVPVYGIPEDTERIIVRVTAYKDEKVISCYPALTLIAGRSVLDNLRTSLR